MTHIGRRKIYRKSIVAGKVLSKFETPCYLVDEAEFRRGVDGFRSALRERFERVPIGYSVKTNSLPYSLMLARACGCKAEVVSEDEYRLARLCGYAPGEIIYNGPMKSETTFLEAVKGGGMVNIETKRELKWLEGLPKNGEYKVGLRLNINISHVSAEDADGDNDNSRFGFSDETSEFGDAVEAIRMMGNVRLSGLHIHRTAHSRSPRFYERSVAYAGVVIRKYGLRLDYLDVGGGYFGIFPNKPTFTDYAEAIFRGLNAHGLEGLRVVVEPGNALTASPFSFLTEVIDTKRVDEETYIATTDGSRNDVDPFFHKSDYLKEVLYDGAGRECERKQVVCGCTCLEYDRLFTLTDKPRLEVGDRILYKNVGAYTMTLSPLFIRLFPRVYAIGSNGEAKEVRAAWTAEDMLAGSRVNNKIENI